MRSLRALPLLVLLAAPLYAQNVLLLNEQCGTSTAYFPSALTSLGLTFTETNDQTAFDAQLTGGTHWDLVIVDEYSSTLSLATITALDAYVASGGRLVMDYFGWDASSAAIFDAGYDIYYDIPQPMYAWIGSSPLLTTPNVLPDPVAPSGDSCKTDGARFTPLAGGTAVSGYTTSPTAGEAGIIVGNGGRTILFGGIPGLFNGDTDGDSKPDGLEIAENLINSALFPTPTAPTLSQWGLMAALGALALAGALRLRA